MRILVTGGLGFAGLNIVRVLAGQDDVWVIAADLLGERRPAVTRFLGPVAERVRWAILDVTDRSAVHQLIQEEGVSHIVHGAALTPTAEQEAQQPTRIVDVNLGGAINVLDGGCRSPLVKAILLMSSSGVYRHPADLAETGAQGEDSALALDSLYGITKVSMEMLASRYGQLTGMQIASLRLASVYGPLERASASRPQTTPISQLHAALLADRFVRVAGLAEKRDWIYAADVGKAVWLLLKAGKYDYPVYNVGSGTTVSFQRVVQAFVTHGLTCAWCEDVESADISMRPEQSRAALDIRRLQEAVGFVPEYDLVSGIADLVHRAQSLQIESSSTEW